MLIVSILNLIAIIVIPIVSVIVGQYLQNRAEKRKDKMQIFKTLMTSRVYGWTVESVHALNIIDVVFADDKAVREAWKDLYDKYSVSNPDQIQLKKIQDAQYKLLEAIAISLGYKDKITWETIQNPYIPDGLVHQLAFQRQSQQSYSEVLAGMSKMMTASNSQEMPNNNSDES